MQRTVMTAQVRSALAALVVACLAVAGASAQQVPEGPPLATWGPNHAARALARVGNTLFVGGDFDYVGPPTGAFVTIDADDASSVSAPSFVLGPVRVLTDDGAGGWFAAPAQAESYAPPEVIHLRADGTRDPAWIPPVIGPDSRGAKGWISAIVVDSGRVFISGGFTSVGGAARTGVAALDLATGALLPWTVQVYPDSHVVTLGPLVAGQLYLSGAFTTVNGASRAGSAAVDPTTGAVLPFNPPGVRIRLPIAAATSTAVYAWCEPVRLCAFDLTGTPLAGWSPPALPPGDSVLATPAAVLVFVAERFVDGRITEWRLLALDPSTGARRAWSEPVFAGGGPPSLSAAGGRLYAAGGFTSVNGVPRLRVAAFDEATGALLAWAPAVGGEVHAVRALGPRVAVAGSFNSVGGVARRNLVAIDLTTGRPRPSPEPDFPVWTLHLLGDIVVAGGGSYNPAAGRAVAFHAASGSALPWGLSTNAPILTLASSNRYLYVGGAFSSVDGQPRNSLAVIDLATAALTPLSQVPLVGIGELAVNDGAIYASGSVIIGQDYFPAVVAFDADTLARLPFTPTPAPSWTSSFVFVPGGVLIAGTMADRPRQAGWFDAGSGQWSPRASSQDFMNGLAAQTGSMIIVAGTSDSGRFAAEVVDRDTGLSAPWDPGLVRGGGFPTIYAMHASNDYLIVSGWLSAGAGVPLANLAVFRMPLAGAPRRITAAVTGQTVTVGWQPGLEPAASAFIVEAGTTPGGSDVGRFNVGTATSVAGTLGAGRYFIRVRGVGAGGEGLPSSEVVVDVPATATPPAAPGPLTASVTGATVSLTWGAATGNATTYVIEAGSASGLANLVTFPTGNLDTALVTGAPPGRYYVRVRAANASGLGPVSNEVVIDVP